MKLQTRNLVFGTLGNDVRELQRELTWLSLDIDSQEIKTQRFGETTRAAVRLLQRQNGLKENGVVEAKTVAAINKKLAGLPRTARGNVLLPDGEPLKGAVVRLFDIDLRTETKLGEAPTSAEGYYEIHHTFAGKDKVAPNLLVKVFATPPNKQPTAVSEVIFAADPEVIINLVAGDGKYRGPSDFELLLKDTKPLVETQKLKFADLLDNDVTFLSNQTGHAPERIVHAILADRYAQESRPASGAAGPPREAIYAWLRQGLPTEPSALLSQHPDVLQRALKQAVKDNIIPQGFETEEKLNAIMESLKAWRAKVALEDSTAGKLIKTVLSEQPLQQRFMERFAEHEGPVSEFWKKLEQDDQLKTHAAELQFAVTVANLGLNHLSLVNEIRKSGFKQVKGLAALKKEDWLALINKPGVGAPEVIEGKDPEEKARRYARTLANAVEEMVPNDFFVARLEESELPDRADLLAIFQADADPPFDIKNTRVDTFINAHPNLANKKVAVKRLKGLQRLYRLQPSAETALALHDVDSAHRISRMGQNAFVATFGQHFDDATQAREVYAKAQHVNASAIGLAGDLNPAVDRVPMAAVPDRVASTIDEIPQWSSLFGSLDFCSCGDCQSVYSAPAYLVDVLNFLKDRKAKLPEIDSPSEPAPEPPSVKDLLFERRPDLGEIELSCENTNTVMPYVDLVLEILEDAVASPPNFSPMPLDSNRIADLDQGKISDELKNDFAGLLSGEASIRVKRAGEWWVLDDERFSYSIRKQESGEPKVENRMPADPRNAGRARREPAVCQPSGIYSAQGSQVPLEFAI